jgi:hypothetical protein
MVGYHMLTGRNPFDASNAQAIMARVLTEDPPDISTSRPDAPAWLTDAIRKATQRQPAKRYEHAEELAEALDRGQTSREIPTSIQTLLDLGEAYVQLSVAAAWIFWILGIPTLPKGGILVIVAFLALPVLSVMQLIHAEGLHWSDIREGIVAKRIHWLRTLSLKREVGIHTPSVVLALITIGGVALIRWFGPVLWFLDSATSPADRFADFEDRGPAGTGEWLFTGPLWLLAYAIVGSVIWARLFGLPLGRRISPQKLDAVASWQLPAWLDRLGCILFKGVGSTSRIIEATSDFRQLAEPAVREAVAFLRMRRMLKWRDRWRLRCPLHLGKLTVRRVWWMHEKLSRLREQAKGDLSDRTARSLNQAIEKRETVLAECAAALSSFRIYLEEVHSTSSGESEEPIEDERIIEELRRLTTPMRRIRRCQWAFVSLWLILLTTLLFWVTPATPAGQYLGQFLLWALLVFIGFQFVKRRFYA